MRHIRKYNEKVNGYYNAKTRVNDSILDNFYNCYKNIFKVDDQYYNEYGDKDSSELLDEIGELTLKYDLDKSDVLFVLNNYDCSFDVDHLLSIVADEWVDESDNTRQQISGTKQQNLFTYQDLLNAFTEGVSIGSEHGEDGKNGVSDDFNEWFDKNYKNKKN